MNPVDDVSYEITLSLTERDLNVVGHDLLDYAERNDKYAAKLRNLGNCPGCFPMMAHHERKVAKLLLDEWNKIIMLRKEVEKNEN